MFQAKILTELYLSNKYKNEKYKKEAQKIFETLDDTIFNKQSHKMCEFYYNQSVFLKQTNNYKAEIEALENCVDCDAKIPYTNISSPIAQRCQDILMEYATQKLKQGPTRKNKYFNNKIEALHMKSKLFKIQKDYETSIFYIRKAIAINDKDKIQSQKILLIEMLLKQLESQYDEKTSLEVKGLLEGMNEYPSTKELNYQFIELEIGEQTKGKKKLSDIKLSILSFEKCAHLEKENPSLYEKAKQVWENGRSILDYAMTYLKNSNKGDEFFYPDVVSY